MKDVYSNLTKIEKKVLMPLMLGHTASQISMLLTITPQSVKSATERLRVKFNVNKSSLIVCHVLQHNMLEQLMAYIQSDYIPKISAMETLNGDK